MNICGSLMDIYDYPPAYFTRQLNPERGLFMDIQKNNS